MRARSGEIRVSVLDRRGNHQAAGIARHAGTIVGREADALAGERDEPGEEKEGVTLVSLTDNAATVSTPMGERELSLSAGIPK